MPQVAIAAIVSGISVNAAGALVFSLSNALIGAALSAVQYLIAESQKPSSSAEAKGRAMMIRSATSPHRSIYGESEISGTLVYAEVTGDDPKYLHLVVVLSGRELEEIGDVYLNDTLSTDSRYAGHVRINRHLGADDQLADNDLIAETTKWTSAHRLRGRAYIYVRLTQNLEVFPTGIPNIKCRVKGHKVYDPRTGLTAWSDNAALCVLDYIRWSQGIGAAGGECAVLPMWDFTNTDDGWVGTDATITPSTDYITVEPTGSNPWIDRFNLVITGNPYYLVRARIRRVAGTGWQGSCYYRTASHGATWGFTKGIPEPPGLSDWVVVEWDMSQLDAGGTDWLDSTILSIRLDLGANSLADIFDIDWITVEKPSHLYNCETDLDSWIAAANACDEEVALDSSELRNTFEAADFGDWTVTTGATLTQDQDAFSGDYAGLFSSTKTAPVSTGTTDAPYLTIPSSIADQFMGNTVRVRFLAKLPSANAAAEFAVAYSTNEVGNSSWQYFTPTDDWVWYEFTYAVPAGTSSEDYLGIWGDTSGGGAGVLIDQLQIDLGNTQARYTCNGTFTLDRAPIDILEELKSSMAGAVVWQQGKWLGHPGVATVANSDPITEDDFRGAVTYRNKPGRDARFNAVRGTFVNPDDHWQPTDFPAVTNPLYATEDGGEVIHKDITLPFTTNGIEAQRISKVALETHRQGLVATLPLKLAPGLKLAVWDVVKVNLSWLGWTDKLFRVRDWQLVPEDDGSLGVDVVVQEYADGIYDWNFGEATLRDLAPNTALPDPFDVASPTGLILSSGSAELLIAADGTVISRMRIDWTLPADSGITRTEIQYRKTGDLDWISVAPARRGESSAWITPVKDGEFYDVQIRTVNLFEVPSPWSGQYSHQVQGKSAVPADVITFSVDRQPDGTRSFTWSPVDEPDLAGYEIHYRLGTGWGWNDLSPLHDGLLTASPWETNQLAAGVYTIAIKAVDTTGNKSTNARFVQSTLGDPRIGDALAYESPHLMGWPGVRTQCTPDDAGLALTALGNYTWDDLTTWDDWLSFAQNPFTQIAYEHTQIDLSAVAAFTPLVSVESTGNPVIEIDWSEDGATWAGWQAAPPSITARYLKARVTVDQVATEVPQINTMTVISSGKTVSEVVSDSHTSTWGGSAAAGRVVPIAKSYAAITSVRLALQSVGPGWTWEILNKNATGPTIRIYNNGVAADALVDVEVTGIPPTA
ncbi:MAG: hypothetical protein JMN25_15820 [gamma proteobacterium endosymbiont of Lamellibrachia anaximandri]|nr:hypothetical protein [gamma proteobacterium endosymbiont of Lamellibrachia anaximandri]